MEVRFRPLRASTLARHVPPGQISSEDGQSFLEVVEDVTGTEQTPGEYPNTNRNKEKPPRNNAWTGPPARDEDATEEREESVSPKQATAPGKETASGEKPVGIRIDMTA